MYLHLRSLAAFLRDVCAACRPAEPPHVWTYQGQPASLPLKPVDDFGYAPDPEPEPELPPLIYHAVVSEMAEALADARAAVHGAADFAAWSAELMVEDER